MTSKYLCRIIVLSLVGILFRFPLYSQFILMECVDSARADYNGVFTVKCTLKNLSVEAGVSSVAERIANIENITIYPYKTIIKTKGNTQILIKGELKNVEEKGIFKLRVRWIDIEGKLMVSEEIIEVNPYQHL